jgi:hypothetical protein
MFLICGISRFSEPTPALAFVYQLLGGFEFS